MRRAWLVLVVAVLAGCGGGGSGSHQGLVSALEDRGVKAVAPRPEPSGVLEVTSTVYQVPGGELHVFTFGSDREARTAARRIAPDGYTVITSSGINQAIDWSAPPHWFRDGREIAVYVGSSSTVIEALSAVAGSQIAGAS